MHYVLVFLLIIALKQCFPPSIRTGLQPETMMRALEQLNFLGALSDTGDMPRGPAVADSYGVGRCGAESFFGFKTMVSGRRKPNS